MFSIIIYILIAAIGFMMGFLYKKTHTTSQFFSPNPKKAFKIFLLVLFAGVLLSSVLSLLSVYVLKSTEIPDEGSMKYKDMKSILIFTLNFFFFVLVVLANAYSQAVKKIVFIPYLLALVFYIGFILLDSHYISDYFISWQKSVALFKEELMDIHRTGWTKCALASAATIFNVFMIWWGLRK